MEEIGSGSGRGVRGNKGEGVKTQFQSLGGECCCEGRGSLCNEAGSRTLGLRDCICGNADWNPEAMRVWP